MSDRIQTLKQALENARHNLLTALQPLSARGEEVIYSDGAGWTLRQLVIHLMITDRGISRIIQQIAEGQNPITPDYDVNRYNHRSVEKNADVTTEQAITAMQQSRSEFVAWLDTIDDATLDIVGRHPLQRDVSLETFIRTQAAHEQSHAEDIIAHFISV